MRLHVLQVTSQMYTLCLRGFSSDLTASIRKDLERETGDLHKMLQQLKQKLLELRNNGLSGKGTDDEMRRRSELVKKLANGELSDEEKQRAKEELGYQNLSDGALQGLLKDKEKYIMAIESNSDQVSPRVPVT